MASKSNLASILVRFVNFIDRGESETEVRTTMVIQVGIHNGKLFRSNALASFLAGHRHPGAPPLELAGHPISRILAAQSRVSTDQNQPIHNGGSIR